jgi:predicted nucleic acid-binding protein
MTNSSRRRRPLAVQQRIRTPYAGAWRPWYATRLTSACGPCAARSLTPATCPDVVRDCRPNEEWPDGSRGHFRVDSVPCRPGALRSGAGQTPLNEVAGHELVYGELLIGHRGGRRKLLAAYERMHQAASVPHRAFVAFVRDRDLHGRGVRWIDVHLLASAIVGRLQLWTADPRFSAVANEFGVAYKAPS